MKLHTYTPKPMSLLCINFLHLTFSEKVKVTNHGQRSYQGHTMTLHTYAPKAMSLQSINFLHLMVSEIQPQQFFPAAHLPAHPDTMGENNTRTALKGCGVKRTSCCKGKSTFFHAITLFSEIIFHIFFYYYFKQYHTHC